MRKSLFILSILLVAVLHSVSVAWAVEPPRVGLLGGFHLSNLDLDPDPADTDNSFLTRAHIGGLAEFELSPVLSFQARGMYVQKGAVLEGDLGNLIGIGETVIDYITVPLLLKFSTDVSNVRPYVVVGPEIGFKTRAKATITDATVLDAGEEFSIDLGDEVRSTDVALDFGGGVEIPYKRVVFLLEGIYSLGLKNISVDSEEGDGEASTRTLLFSVGVRF